MDTISQTNIDTDLYSKYNTLDNKKNLQENANSFRNPLQKIDSKNLSISKTPVSSFLLANGGLDFALKALKRNIEGLQKQKQTLKLKNGNLELELSQAIEQNKILEAENLDLNNKNDIYEKSINELKARVQGLIDAKTENITQPTPVIPTPPQTQQSQSPQTHTHTQPTQANPMNPIPPINPATIIPTPTVKNNVASPNEVLHDVADFLNFDNSTDQLTTLLDKDLGTKEPAIKTTLNEIIASEDVNITPMEVPVNFDDVINQQAKTTPSLEDHEEFNNFLSKNNTPPPPIPQPKDFVITNNIPNIANPAPTHMKPPSVSNIIDKNHTNINKISKSLGNPPQTNLPQANPNPNPRNIPPQPQAQPQNLTQPPNPNNQNKNPIPNLNLMPNK